MLLSQPSRLSVFVLLSRPSCPSASCCCRGLRVARVLQPSSGSHSRNLCSWISHPASCLRGCFWPASGDFCSVAFGPKKKIRCCHVPALQRRRPRRRHSIPVHPLRGGKAPSGDQRKRGGRDHQTMLHLFHYDVSSEVLWFPLSVTKHDAGCSSLPFGCRSNPASTFRNCAHRRASDLCRREALPPLSGTPTTSTGRATRLWTTARTSTSPIAATIPSCACTRTAAWSRSAGSCSTTARSTMPV